MPGVTVSNVDPSSEYGISDLDSGGSTQYFGFLDRHDNWMIMQVTSTTVRYVKGVGLSSYQTSWTGRAGLSYDYFSTVFK
jgi:hypothetical protein